MAKLFPVLIALYGWFLLHAHRSEKRRTQHNGPSVCYHCASPAPPLVIWRSQIAPSGAQVECKFSPAFLHAGNSLLFTASAYPPFPFTPSPLHPVHPPPLIRVRRTWRLGGDWSAEHQPVNHRYTTIGTAISTDAQTSAAQE